MLVLENKLPLTTPAARIPLNDGKYALIDPDWFDRLNIWHWYAKKSFYRYYACTKVVEKGRTYFLRMHRIIAGTPNDMVCHHINGNTLDNRRENLLNMTWYDHTKKHSYR